MYNVRMTTTDLRYPIGEFAMPASVTPAMRSDAIAAIADLPACMRAAVRGLSDAQLDTPYRPGGWTVRQVVHHVPDSHMNAFVRLKLALTEDNPTVKPYDEKAFAALADTRLPVHASHFLLEGLHERWVAVLNALTPEQFARPLHHPEIGAITVDYLVQTYAWHSRHHVAHITRLREREGW
jgi:DinB superfamily